MFLNSNQFFALFNLNQSILKCNAYIKIINSFSNMEEDNQIRKFQCNKCHKSNYVLKKVWDQQQHGFACEECWNSIEKQKQHRYKGCVIG